jgi:hypothetical protein
MNAPHDIVSLHQIYGFASFAIGLWGTSIYIASIFRGETRPHVYTHLVWGTVTAIAFFAQLRDGAGPGAWASGITAAACLFQAGLATLKYGEKTITLSDTLSLAGASLALLAWFVARDPLLSVVLAAVVNMAAFSPTFRKSWDKPWQENLTAYNIANVKQLLSLLALDHVTWTTAFYPAACVGFNILFVLLCYWRRRALTVAATA